MWAFRAVLLVGCLLLVSQDALGQPVNPEIIIDNVNGANPPAASGAPANFGPVIPPNQCATAGASTTIQSVGHGLGAVPTDGSAAVWIGTAAGRRWSKITGVPNGDTFTVQDTFNIGAAVDCVVGGEIAGTLKNVTRLCDDLRQGWTVTLQNTGTPYTDSGTVCAVGTTGSVITDGRIVIRGDDPDNPTEIQWGSNNDYISQAGANSTKVENISFIRNAAGTTGSPVFAATNGGVLKNIQVSNSVGQWIVGWNAGSQPVAVINSLFDGPFALGCSVSDDNDFIFSNSMLGCSGSGSALDGAVLAFFNIIDNEGDNGNGAAVNGIFLYNTLLGIGGSGTVALGQQSATIVSGTLIGEASSLSGACFNTGSLAAVNLMGLAGEPHILWGGNAANECPTARYGNNLDLSPQGAPNDIDGGNQIDPTFTDEPNLDLFPLNTAVKDDSVFPGLAYPFQTPAEPQSTTTAGAAQLPGSGGVSAYAY